MRKIRVILLLLICTSVSTSAVADSLSVRDTYYQQNLESEDFDREAWEDLKAGLDYSEEPEEKEEDKQEEEEDSERSESRDYSSPFTLDSTFLQVVFYVLIIGLLVFLLLRIFAGNLFRSNKKIPGNQPAFTLEELDENFQESDLERLLRESLEREDYPMAIRVHFLMIIKELDLRELIHWKKDKTNFDYVREMSSHALARDFREVTIIFDYIWYGGHEINLATYQLLGEQSRKFLKQLQATR